ncbi:unnamed protein product [Leptidea sinapis]|uniref:CUE domain-containing protein n=1 Tax=Leptidea sinapis TaxID=189913 RepID=A0A5E4Q1Q2_9NEOP|nr:unnamed protein product [Leptidea sinapis]
MSSTTQLEFTQAMSDFKTMFPDMDDDVIEAVLRANQGAVDATIDQLLAMSTDNQNERLRLEIERVERPLPPMFLRIPPSTDARIDLTLDMDDDRIATLLQNEEFMAELRWNQEFIAALDSEQGNKTKSPPRGPPDSLLLQEEHSDDDERSHAQHVKI